MKRIFSTILFTGLAVAAMAQQQPQYSLFMFTKQTVNPAYVGSRDALSVNSDYRTQWTAVDDGNPETFFVGVHSPLGKGAEVSHHAGGLKFFHDQIGVTTTNSFGAQYAYRLRLGEKTLLSLGMEANFTSVSNNVGDLRVDDPNDAAIQQMSDGNKLYPNFGFGAYLYNDRYYLGVSAPTLLEREELSDDIDDFNTVRHYFAMAGYLQPINDLFKVRVNGMLKLDREGVTDLPVSSDFNLSGIYRDRFILGASYRTDNTIIAMAHVQVTRLLNVGYAYDFKSGEYGRTAGGNSHEIFIGLDFGEANKRLTTPRFVSYF